MPKQTQTFRLGYFTKGEITDSLTESRRWNTLDNQLKGLYELLGSGIVNGWKIRGSEQGLSLSISAGNGVISFLSVSSGQSELLTGLTPSASNYIYAVTTKNSYWSGEVSFSSRVTEVNSSNYVYLGKAVTNSNSVSSVDMNGRANIGLASAVQALVKDHKHIGGDENPEQIDLATEVRGQIGQKNLPPLDASLLLSGKIDEQRIPLIDHKGGLTNQGVLSHAQLDSFVQGLLNQSKTLMGETALTNFLQLVLALKHQWPDVDDYLVNEIAFIPGISPDSMIDTLNTTAYVDTRPASEGGEHIISGTAAPARDIFTKTWETQEEFSAADITSLSVSGDSLILNPALVTASIEDFDKVSDWTTEIIDLSSSAGTLYTDRTTFVDGGTSGRLDLNVNLTSNLAFVMKKSFPAQDWKDYSRIVFHLRTEEIDHGDIYFFFEDSTGAQESFTLVIPDGNPTINRDSLEIGWRELSVDISDMMRDSVISVGFYTSTNTGWNPSRPFSLNADQMYLSSGNKFAPSGKAVFTFESNLPQSFWRVRWDSLDPRGTVLKFRTRMADDVEDFFGDSQPAWSSYSSANGFTVSNSAGSLRACAQIEAYMEPSLGEEYSPELNRLYLDSYVASIEEVFSLNTQDDWESGESVNIDTKTVPGQISVDGIADVNNVFYGTSGSAVQTDDSLDSLYNIVGTSLPRSTPQLLNGSSSSLGQVSGICRGDKDTVWIADTDNDRVVNVRKDGSLVFGMYGSFLAEPKYDPYGEEDSGPGSGKEVEISELDSTSVSDLPNVPPVALQSIYNPRTRQLSIVFDNPLETLHGRYSTFNPEKFMLKAGSNRVYFSADAQFNLLGIDPSNYDYWLGSDNMYINQFSFKSHVLQATLSQADATVLDSIVNMTIPSLTISSPYEQQMIDSTSVTINFVPLNFEIGGGSGQQIRYRLDSGSYNYIDTPQTTLTELPEGEHLIEASLMDSEGNYINNKEASVSLNFVTNSGVYSLPYISITSPVQSQILSAPISFSFLVENHPLTPTGSYMVYSIDGEAPIAHRTPDSIFVETLAQGSHEITMSLVDEFGTVLSEPWGTASVSFFVGVTSLSDLTLSISAGAIALDGKNHDKLSTFEVKIPVLDTSLPITVANIVFCNLYSPIDVEFVPGEISEADTSGQASILVAKLRSPSWTTDLGTKVADGSTSLPDDSSIFGTNYLGGHSVIEYNSEGDIIMTNNAAKFASDRASAKSLLGSAQKGGAGELFIADSIRNRAIITSTDLESQKTYVAWEYLSDRAICDFRLIKQEEITISVKESEADPNSVTIKTGQTVVWKNDSSSAITIYSGSVTAAQFEADPDLTLYGDEFSSNQLQPGESFSHTFYNLGNKSWFAYPIFVSGEINISAVRTSSRDKYLILENDTSSFLFGSRVIRVDSWGNVEWSFGEGYLANPRDARPMLDGSVIIST